MKSDSIKTVRGFLKYLQSERFVPSGKIHGQQIGYTKREPVSILDMEEFIKEKTGYDRRKLKALRQDVQWYINDEEFEAEAINEETKRSSNDEFFLADRAFWKQEYEERFNKLSDISKLRVRVLLRWIKAKRISDDEFELKEQYPDDIVDAVAAKQYHDSLEPGEGIFYPDTRQLYSFLRMIDYKIQKVESLNREDPRKKLDSNVKSKIGSFAKQIDSDNRSPYKFEEVEMYLSVYKAYPELNSCEKRRDKAVKFLSEDATIRLKKAKPNTLSTSWQKKLNENL